MNELVFLDTETTGNDVLNDRLFQVCYKHDDRLHSEYFKPTVPISIKSQSITHVTNKMVEEKEPFKESKMAKELNKLFEEKILVAHNAVFDIAMLTHEEVSVPKFICTLKVARAMDKEGAIPEYNLQYLRYLLELDIIGKAHEAEIDVLVLEALFKRLYDKMILEYHDHERVLEEMMRVSLEPSLFVNFSFGKHRGKKVAEVLLTDRSYMEWLLEKKIQNGEADDDWTYTLKYHLKVQ